MRTSLLRRFLAIADRNRRNPSTTLSTPINMAALANMHAVTLGSRAVAGRKVATRKTSVAARPARANVIVRAAATERKFNFSAGPACLPLDVLEEMKEDLVNYKCVFLACRRTPRDVSSFSSDPTRRIARPSRPARALASRSARFRARTSTAAVDIFSRRRASETRPRR